MTDPQVDLRARRDFFERLIYRSTGVRRYTQDSPILPDVWIAYGLEPQKAHDLLFTPTFGSSAGQLALALKERLTKDSKSDCHQKFLAARRNRRGIKLGKARIAYNQSTVVGRLWFHQLVRDALPLAGWWFRHLQRPDADSMVMRFGRPEERQKLRAEMTAALREERRQRQGGDEADDSDATRRDRRPERRDAAASTLLWMARVIGLIAVLADLEQTGAVTISALERLANDEERLVNALFELLDGTAAGDPEMQPAPLWSVSRNRPSVSAIYRSVPTIKGDAARRVFEVSGKDIRWAILDSGIDATHVAFRERDRDGKPIEPAFAKKDPAPRRGSKWDNNTRVIATYDFTKIREILAGEIDLEAELPESVRDEIDAEELVDSLERTLQTGRMLDWSLLEPILRVPHDDDYAKKRVPKSEHGTHVAGILAADWRPEDLDDDPLVADRVFGRADHRIGVCPVIELYDLRVLEDDGTGDEFSIIAALQFVRALNASKDYVEIHGVNLSLSIRHEVSNYACGRTPVCDECERLVGNGIVVVAAAGNDGRTHYLNRAGDEEEAYRSVSITDPGNTEAVITVGATHRREPHTYGVSYFSSRGPTGDGRIKPDLVAPGEKICSTLPGNREDYLDGTSMAAPHVSGAAALLMSRHPELVGRPARIKEILCATATDLGRERYFQGAGLLDVFRALQSI